MQISNASRHLYEVRIRLVLTIGSGSLAALTHLCLELTHASSVEHRVGEEASDADEAQTFLRLLVAEGEGRVVVDSPPSRRYRVWVVRSHRRRRGGRGAMKKPHARAPRPSAATGRQSPRARYDSNDGRPRHALIGSARKKAEPHRSG